MPSLAAIKRLLRLCELPDLELAPEHAQSLRETGALARVGALRVLPVPDTIWVAYRDDEVPVDLEAHPDPSQFRRYKCPETGIWITVAEPDVRTYAVDLTWLTAFVGRALTPTFARPVATLIPDVLFDLGPHPIGDRLADVLLCRRFDRHTDTLSGVLYGRRYRQPSLLFTTAPPRLPLPAASGHFVVLALEHCLIEEDGTAQLDHHYLAQVIGLPREALVAADEVYFNPASGELRLPGKPVTQFTGDQQIALIDRLYQAWRQRSPDVKAAELLKAAKTEAPTVSHLFSRRPDWKVYIASLKRGWYRLNV
ncbi:hypothetical protein EWI61_04815 [Methylolobus aquaticus]|nr:hypothetical protein EWI61_04815 [Methylolobus aquaticus]